MTAIAKALGSGYGAQKILRYLSEQNPKLAGQITSALNAGHSIDHILNFVQKNSSRIGKLIPDKKETQSSSNLYETAKKQVHPSLIGAAKAGASVAGAYAISRAVPKIAQSMIGQNIQQGLTSPIATSLSSPTSQPTPTLETQSQIPAQQQGIDQTKESQLPPINKENIPQPPDLNQGIDLSKLNKFKGLTDKIDSLVESGNGSEEIVGYFKKFNASQTAKLEKEVGKPIEEIISGYLGQKPNVEKIITPTQEQASMEQPVEKLDVPQEVERIEEVKPEPIQKSSIVSSPQGVGEVKEIRNGQAIVEVDGKKHKVPVEELESSPLPEKELSDLYDDLIKGIESTTGEDVSRMVQWAGYDPETNTLQFLPHSGKLYTYDDISPEDAALLTDVLSTRKTSGSNFIGVWKEGSKSPIGAALSKMIRKLQTERGGKGKEYSGSYETIYSAYEPAVQSKKKKKKV